MSLTRRGGGGERQLPPCKYNVVAFTFGTEQLRPTSKSVAELVLYLIWLGREHENLVVFELLGLNNPYSRPTVADFHHIARHCRKQFFHHYIIEDNQWQMSYLINWLSTLLPPLNHTFSLRNSLNYYIM
jgi:hypothetical protein